MLLSGSRLSKRAAEMSFPLNSERYNSENVRRSIVNPTDFQAVDASLFNLPDGYLCAVCSISWTFVLHEPLQGMASVKHKSHELSLIHFNLPMRKPSSDENLCEKFINMENLIENLASSFYLNMHIQKRRQKRSVLMEIKEKRFFFFLGSKFFGSGVV